MLLLGKQRFSNVDIRIRVKGGGHVSQVYAIRQAIAKALVAFYQKCEPRPPPIMWLEQGVTDVPVIVDYLFPFRSAELESVIDWGIPQLLDTV